MFHTHELNSLHNQKYSSPKLEHYVQIRQRQQDHGTANLPFQWEQPRHVRCIIKKYHDVNHYLSKNENKQVMN